MLQKTHVIMIHSAETSFTSDIPLDDLQCILPFFEEKTPLDALAPVWIFMSREQILAIVFIDGFPFTPPFPFWKNINSMRDGLLCDCEI